MDEEHIQLLRIAAECVRDACIVYDTAKGFAETTSWEMPQYTKKYLKEVAGEFSDQRISYEDNPNLAYDHRKTVKEMIERIVEAT